MIIQTPILKGFHPDPSIVRVGDDYYLATSTFEWRPGVRLHHSRDLKNWELIEYPLSRMSQLDLLVQSNDPSPFPALTQIEVYGMVNPEFLLAGGEGSYQDQQFPGALKDYSSAMKQKEEQVSWHPVLQK